jgi:lysophospholipase L1-like esterase
MDFPVGVLRRVGVAVWLVALAMADTSNALSAPAAMECTAPKDAVRLNVKLPNTARAIRQGNELIVVAIGSSSTQGVGASSAGNTYPARFARELALRWSRLRLRVFNEGVGGETASEMLARFETDVLAHKPHLVIWQSGSNSLLRGKAVEDYVATVRAGILRLKAAGTDVILMDPQFAPMVVAQPAHRRLILSIRALANDLRVGLFQRFAVMRHWVSSGGTRIEDVISRDRLHMNDASYACIARLLADSVSAAAQEALGPTPASLLPRFRRSPSK